MNEFQVLNDLFYVFFNIWKIRSYFSTFPSFTFLFVSYSPNRAYFGKYTSLNSELARAEEQFYF